MQKTQLICSAIASYILVSALTSITGGVAQAQPRSISLLHARCVNSGIGSAERERQDVSIGRAVYTSDFYLGPGNRSASITCKIKPDNNPQTVFQTLNLGFGMRDNDAKSPNVEISVYLDGKRTDSQIVGSSQPVLLSLNVTNISNVSIEATCSSKTQYCNRVYFYNATLQMPTSLQHKKS